ncbi:glycosyltransferase [Streptomyces sp. ASQP_92]|uniref:glycosyltransferase family 2 protein n=1 Tax=Streptomyces sp. ASQP_92 TaxID=2979116 RepID=UPI0021C02684|nr:glycosyltransferase family 2 protein [Streptomyces sp. ASQP_92]MCT9087644.1 glycosyltransferase [Streptomyces sp. ASQP_92]
MSQSSTSSGGPQRVSVVVIAYNDAGLVGAAVRSALAQGPAVGEVVAVDDCSSDDTAAVLDQLATTEPRLRVVRRTENSGGCGTPRNDGIAAATGAYVMFLDSDDVLPPGAVEALLTAAEKHGTEITVGRAVRRELPAGRDVRWQPGLYREAAVYESPEDEPALLHDTLCVNKLYRRDFLTSRHIRFPDGKFVYEDFVFTARVYAAAPRVAVVPELVYIWHVRRAAAQVSLSLARKDVANWQARITAHTEAVEAFRAAGRPALAAACRTKFVDYDLCLYLRELRVRDAVYQARWWELTRAHLAGFEAADVAAAAAPSRWLARVVLAADEPRDLDRLSQLAADPARLTPPYAAEGSTPVWADDLVDVPLDGFEALPADRLPVTVDATLLAGRRGVLKLRVHELYGRLAAAGAPTSADVEFVPRDGGESALTVTAPLRESDGGWSGQVPVSLARLAAYGGRGTQIWDLRVRLNTPAGPGARTAVRARAAGLRRTAVPGSRYGVLLVQPYRTSSGSLAVRLAPGVQGAFGVVGGKLRRLARTARSRRR